MNTITLPGTSLAVSEICYGTADLGANMDDDTVDGLIDAYRDAGGIFLDTAHVYAFWTTSGAGSSERAIARYRKRRGADELIVATKGGHPGVAGYRANDDWLAPYRVRADIEDSLGRLEVDTIDLFYLHRDDTSREVGAIVEMLNQEIQRGTIRAIGASNWTPSRIKAANSYAAEHGLAGFCISQVQWSLAHREPPAEKPRGDQTIFAGDAEVSFHSDTQLPLAAFSSTGGGFFATDGAAGRAYANDTSRSRLSRVKELAAKKGCTPTQIAIAWLRSRPFPCIPITGTCSVPHLRENLGASNVSLSAGEAAWLCE